MFVFLNVFNDVQEEEEEEKKRSLMCYQGVEIVVCLEFVINECHRCNFTVSL